MTDFSAYMTYIGNDNYQMFIKNNQSETEFIKIIIGYTEMVNGERTGKAVNSWIISPLKSTDEPVFIQSVNKYSMHGRRIWVAFEAVKRSKPKNKVINSFIALSPTVGKWRKTIGASTYLDVQVIDSSHQIEDMHTSRYLTHG